MFSEIKEFLKTEQCCLNRTFFSRGLREEVPHLVRGFTLIELLVVIGIIAILAAVVILTLQPAELLSQARDGTRLAEVASINKAIGFAIAQDSGIGLGSAATVYLSLPDQNSNCSNYSSQLPPLGGSWQYHCAPLSTLQSVNGNGWLPINFSNLGMVPLDVLPTDPINDAARGLYYMYIPGYEIDAKMESAKFINTGISDKESTDGGDDPDIFEVGTKLSSLPGFGIVFNSTSSVTSPSNVSVLGWSHTVKPGFSKILLVGISSYKSGGPPDVTSVAYRGIPLTKVGRSSLSIVGPKGIDSSFWYLRSPRVGTGDISVVFGTLVINAVGGALSLNGVDQFVPIEATNFSTGNNQVALNVTTLTSGAWVVDHVAYIDDVFGLTVGPGQTQNWKKVPPFGDPWLYGASSYKVPASTGPALMGWLNGGGPEWASFGVALRPKP